MNFMNIITVGCIIIFIISVVAIKTSKNKDIINDFKDIAKYSFIVLVVICGIRITSNHFYIQAKNEASNFNVQKEALIESIDEVLTIGEIYDTEDYYILKLNPNPSDKGTAGLAQEALQKEVVTQSIIIVPRTPENAAIVEAYIEAHDNYDNTIAAHQMANFFAWLAGRD